MFLNQLSLIAFVEDDLVADVEFGQQYLRIARELGQQRDEAIALSNLGLAWLRLGDEGQTRRYLEEALQAHRAIRDRVMEGFAISHLCDLALRQGDDPLALVHAQAALDVAVETQGRRLEAGALLGLGSAELALGRHAAARAAFERSHAVAAAIGHVSRYSATEGLARVSLAQDDIPGAMREIGDLLTHLEGGGALPGMRHPHVIQFTCHRVLARAGDPRADAMLVGAHTTLQAVAATIADLNLRRGYLSNIPTHRDIVAAWAASRG